MKIADILGLDKARHVNSIRVGGIVGKHEIIFGLPNQTIRLVHESISKAAFGQGAIFAAKWLNTAPAGCIRWKYHRRHVQEKHPRLLITAVFGNGFNRA